MSQSQKLRRTIFMAAVLTSLTCADAMAVGEETVTVKMLGDGSHALQSYCYSPFIPGCRWLGADGDVVTATQSCGFNFNDTLLRDSIVTQIDVRVSMLSNTSFVGGIGIVTLN